jgi:hypothetical protein
MFRSYMWAIFRLSTVTHNYILLSSTVRIQLHVSALYVGHLQVEYSQTQLYFT